ncbi:MAG: hypothetical protein IH968_06745 [Gemmatimonadetes bacterium]|nr:hypothetical protein [Gemmatimonadota bacterium]
MDGSVVASIGRAGDGPGEFSFPTALGVIGDTLWVMDPRAQRINYFENLQFVEAVAFSQPSGLHPERRAREVAVLKGGGVLMVTDSQSPFDPSVTTTPSLILVRHDDRLDTLATYSTDNRAGFLIRMSGGAISMMRPFTQPFTAAGRWAVSPDATAVLLVDQEQSGVEQGESSFGVTMLRTSGDTVLSTRLSYSPIPIPPGHVEAVLADLRGDQFTEEEVRESIFLPPHYPPVSGALIATDGSIWIGREAQLNSSVTWNVLSSTGEWIANLTIPSGFTVHAVSGDHVWGLTHDEFDVPYVERRPIVRR